VAETGKSGPNGYRKNLSAKSGVRTRLQETEDNCQRKRPIPSETTQEEDLPGKKTPGVQRGGHSSKKEEDKGEEKKDFIIPSI